MSDNQQKPELNPIEVFDSFTEDQKTLIEALVHHATELGDDFWPGPGGFEVDLAGPDADELEEMREELIDLINELAVVRGKVTLSSGKEADYYIDLRRVTLHSQGAPLIGELMLAHLGGLGYLPDDLEPDEDDDYLEHTPGGGINYSAVGGLTLGADPIAAAILHTAASYNLEIDAFVVRKAAKAHGMQRQIEGPDIAGRNVVIVEDTTTTGSSPIAAIEAARAAGANPIAVATIVDRDTGAREKIEALGVPYYPLLTLDDLTI